MAALKLIVSSVVIMFISYFYLVWNSNPFNPDDLVGKNVLVTGASSGIGKAVAIQYAKYGANVFITARRENLLKEVVAVCESEGRPNAKFGYVTADMANYKVEAGRVIQKTISFFGGLDHIILNHALMHAPELFQEHGWSGTAEELSATEALFEIGMFSYIHLTAHALPHIKKSAAGRIGIMGSINGKTAPRSEPSYSSVKFALDGFYSSLRELFEHEGFDVAVTYHVIGPIVTGAWNVDIPKNMLDPEQMFFYMPMSTPELAAEEIVMATTRGDAEMYYPHLFGYIRGGCRIFPIIRHLWHNLIRTT